MWPDIDRGAIRRLDDAFSRLKLEIGVTAREVATDPEPGPVAPQLPGVRAGARGRGGLDFDDLVARALRLLDARPPLLRRCGPNASTCWSTKCRTSTEHNSGWPCCWPLRRTGYSPLAMMIRRMTHHFRVRAHFPAYGEPKDCMKPLSCRDRDHEDAVAGDDDRPGPTSQSVATESELRWPPQVRAV